MSKKVSKGEPKDVQKVSKGTPKLYPKARKKQMFKTYRKGCQINIGKLSMTETSVK